MTRSSRLGWNPLRRRERGPRGSANSRASAIQARAGNDECGVGTHHQPSEGTAENGNGHAMTNTLHRFGDADSSAMTISYSQCAAGETMTRTRFRNCEGPRDALSFNPVNLRDARHGGALRPSQSNEPSFALEPGYQARFPRRDRRVQCSHYGDRGVRQSRRGGGLDESRRGGGFGI